MNIFNRIKEFVTEEWYFKDISPIVIKETKEYYTFYLDLKLCSNQDSDLLEGIDYYEGEERKRLEKLLELNYLNIKIYKINIEGKEKLFEIVNEILFEGNQEVKIEKEDWLSDLKSGLLYINKKLLIEKYRYINLQLLDGDYEKTNCKLGNSIYLGEEEIEDLKMKLKNISLKIEEEKKLVLIGLEKEIKEKREILVKELEKRNILFNLEEEAGKKKAIESLSKTLEEGTNILDNVLEIGSSFSEIAGDLENTKNVLETKIKEFKELVNKSKLLNLKIVNLKVELNKAKEGNNLKEIEESKKEIELCEKELKEMNDSISKLKLELKQIKEKN